MAVTAFSAEQQALEAAAGARQRATRWADAKPTLIAIVASAGWLAAAYVAVHWPESATMAALRNSRRVRRAWCSAILLATAATAVSQTVR